LPLADDDGDAEPERVKPFAALAALKRSGPVN
jgi:hypothetical protein